MGAANRIAYSTTRLLPLKQRVGLLRWLKGRSQRAKLAKSDVVLISYPKSGRTWFRIMLSRCYAQTFGLDDTKLIKVDNFHRLDRRVPVFHSFHGSMIREVTTGKDPDRLLEGKKIIFLARNPIDVSVSCYFHLLGGRTKPHNREMKSIPKSIEEIPISEFVRTTQWSVAHIVDFMNEWTALLSGNSNVLVVKYESLRENPRSELERVNAFLGKPFTDAAMDSAIESSRFEKLQQQERDGVFVNSALQPREPENPNSYKVRRGKIGGYVDYLDGACVAEVESLVANKLTADLGYRDQN